ncbi:MULTISPECIES: IS21 family transposase [unclassified Clostridium]|uniref:IS21 family transposase n=1 Tax=unclassified Clostridium TaxID=2614128 RepID=UPI0013F90CFA|nr:MULTISPECIES: IS21 family transposase [unclassified Clostridium]MBN1039994.1 IS21 family transposase [Clostridium botulinum]MBN1047125.1 IS21 family transposase [Clostridium botulinum]NFR88539.1 IS21 family transposase [Clostridium botulinum]NFR91879.1 IS21 family transposase [Clostridium botulinum]NFU00698.1 IS21 family transposase [Clostridium botulinum]
MIIEVDVHSEVKINKLEDLHKIKPIMEGNNLKINKSQIARELDVDPRTVGKYLNGYIKSTTRNRKSKIEAFEPIIKELLSKDSIQIFYYKRILWQYLKDNHGLDCAQSSFRRYISNHSEFNDYFTNRKNGHISTATPMRYETDKGKQAQLDWKENIEFVLTSGEVVNINIFVLILSYSRFRVYKLSLDKTQDILFSFLDEAFETFGGIPHEVLTDNMKTVMAEARTNYSKGKVNNKFQQFADDYGFKVRPCIAGRPNTKAKVEAPMKLLDEIRAYNGTLNYEELHKLVSNLNNRINGTCHTSTGKIPVLHLQKEKDFLLEPPKDQIRNHYKIITTSVKVNRQSMISYKSNQYSVPPEYIGKKLKLQVYDDQLHVYYNTNLVTIHRIQTLKLNYHADHYVKISALTFNKQSYEMIEMAKNNLKMIGDVYKNE